MMRKISDEWFGTLSIYKWTIRKETRKDMEGRKKLGEDDVEDERKERRKNTQQTF